MNFTVLLTCVGGDLAPQTIRYLKDSSRHRVTVVGIDMRPDATGGFFADHFHVVPAGSAPDYVGTVADLIERYKVDLVLPTSDEEALALAENRDILTGRGSRLACAPIEVLRMVANKADTYAWLERHGVPVPAWRRAADLDQLADAVKALLTSHGDVVVKPAAMRGGRNVCVIRHDLKGAHPFNQGREIHLDRTTFFERYLTAFADFMPTMVMQRLYEPVYDIDVLAWEGKVLRAIPRRRHNPAGIPFRGNSFDLRPDLEALGRQAAEAIGLSWLYDFDVMSTADGRPMIIEVNPRPSGSLAASIAAGVPLLDDLISLAKGEALPESSYPAHRTVVPYLSLIAKDEPS